MDSEHDSLYRALCARDRRFDGRFFVGVTSTGIYCRPVCRVRTPKAANCRFFAHAAAAEAAGFRPCLLCRPELAPGLSRLDMPSSLAWRAARLIDSGFLDEHDEESLAARIGISSRHLRRIFAEAIGVSPLAYAQTRRLLTAKRLLTETGLPLTEVALAAGFGSVRRFNALWQQHYRLTPGQLRRNTRLTPASEALTLRLAYRPPLDWPRLLAFLAARSIRGVESVADDEYRRSVQLTHGEDSLQGWLSLRASDKDKPELLLTVAPGLLPALPAILARVSHLCDLSAEPQLIAAALGELAAAAPGLRVPGCVDGFEMAIRAILGQQVTVKAAHTLAGRVVAALGTPIATPFAEISHLFPTPAQLLASSVDQLGSLGIVRQRGGAMLALAQAVQDGLPLTPGADAADTIARLEALPGIGRWTAQYIALRALGEPDAWPSGDVALMKALGCSKAREADELARQWQPWRAYATLHLWRQLGENANKEKEK